MVPPNEVFTNALPKRLTFPPWDRVIYRGLVELIEPISEKVFDGFCHALSVVWDGVPHSDGQDYHRMSISLAALGNELRNGAGQDAVTSYWRRGAIQHTVAGLDHYWSTALDGKRVGDFTFTRATSALALPLGGIDDEDTPNLGPLIVSYFPAGSVTTYAGIDHLIEFQSPALFISFQSRPFDAPLPNWQSSPIYSEDSDEISDMLYADELIEDDVFTLVFSVDEGFLQEDIAALCQRYLADGDMVSACGIATAFRALRVHI